MKFFRSANCLANDLQWANCWAKYQWTCFGWDSSREPPIEPKFFLELLTSYTHVFNTEARIFDHFLNFPNRASTLYRRLNLCELSLGNFSKVSAKIRIPHIYRSSLDIPIRVMWIVFVQHLLILFGQFSAYVSFPREHYLHIKSMRSIRRRTSIWYQCYLGNSEKIASCT